ncbi:MAG: 5-formyltetrahydrofolate cyclo-ligase [Candidatus Hecatellales archaeon]|nr:MAG: 5-formyltetrahydrofolate cyclo-ligase [Candidatus Hecatellales archaeon]
MEKEDTKNAKKELREKIWSLMEKNRVARFPLPLKDRIPNFEGSEKAAERVRELGLWLKAKVVFVNPDYAQKKVREYVLKDGKVLVMASPKLKQGFLLVNPEKVKGKEDFASTIKGAFRYGKTVTLNEIPKPDLIVTGCVAVDKDGFRLGKGGGYGDREVNMLREKFGYIPVITTIHETQIVDRVPREEYDVKVDVAVTPTKIIFFRKS